MKGFSFHIEKETGLEYFVYLAAQKTNYQTGILSYELRNNRTKWPTYEES